MTTTERREILERLDVADRACVESLDCFAEIDSTSAWLMREAPPAAGRCRIALADRQTAGRGRRGKQWLSPPGAGLWLSVAYTLPGPPSQRPALTLAIGAHIAEALNAHGADIRLKWPNDLMAADGKLGGILTETQTRGAMQTVIAGVGINIALPATVAAQLEEERGARVTDLGACMAVLPANAELAATVIHALLESMRRFAAGELGSALAVWQRYDWLAGKQVVIEQGGQRIAGTASGIDEDGALLLRTNGRTHRVLSGSVAVPGSAEACA